jgi:hypothetical protein
VSAALTAGGYTVGQVTSSPPAPGAQAGSAIEYPAAQLQQATGLAGALHATAALREAQVQELTLLLTTADPEHLLAAVTALAPACAAGTPTN